MAIYQELTKALYQDTSLVDVDRQTDVLKKEYEPLIEKLTTRPLMAWKYNNLVVYRLKEHKTWYMERDRLLLMVSVDTSNRDFKWDDSDTEVGLNCQKLIDDNMLLRSTTYYN